MNYLLPAEYEAFGLDAETGDDLVQAASAMIDGFCRRPGLYVQQYTERLRFAQGGESVWLSHGPVVALVQVRVRLSRRGAMSAYRDALQQVATVFGLYGSWTTVDVSTVEVSNTGEVRIAPNFFGVAYDEVGITYTAGWAAIPGAVKVACAQVVKNAQATPGLNVKKSQVGGGVDAMKMEYFSGALLGDETKRLLKPYVAVRL